MSRSRASVDRQLPPRVPESHQSVLEWQWLSRSSHHLLFPRLDHQPCPRLSPRLIHQSCRRELGWSRWMVSTDSVPMALALIWSVGLEQPWPWSGQRLRQMCECWMVRAYPWVVLDQPRL